MIDPKAALLERVQVAFDAVAKGSDPVLRASGRADFQANGVLAVAKQLGRKPHEVAAEVLDALEAEDLCSKIEISGPGFLNFTIRNDCLEVALSKLAEDEFFGLMVSRCQETVVIDYSAPNVAKEMHVGNLRSTILGDSLARIWSRLGAKVIRENHLGDWGTPFGMLIEHLIDIGEKETAEELSVGDLSRFYQQARSSFEENADFQERSRARVVLLQAGDVETLKLWKILVDQSMEYFNEVYATLDVLLVDADIVGESFYNPMLPAVIDDLIEQKLLVEDDGAQCVFLEGFSNREGNPLPLIVRKSDGGYGYAATDLAALRDRIDRLFATRILYVVGAPQAMHLSMCIAVAKLAGWIPPSCQVEHVSFGSVLGKDKKMFKTRAGESVKLVTLLNEAVTRAKKAIVDRRPTLSGAELEDLARGVGIGAVKYADLANDRIKDYVFDFDKMIAFDGDTGPYLQYAHARVCSIFRRAQITRATLKGEFKITHTAERALGLAMLSYPEAVATAAYTSAPSKLCHRLSSIASAFTTFYEQCQVLGEQDASIKESRLLIADLAARVLADGLFLLGILAPQQM